MIFDYEENQAPLEESEGVFLCDMNRRIPVSLVAQERLRMAE